MNDSVFEAVETSSRVLRLDFSSIEFAKLAEEQDFSQEQIQAVGMVFAHLQRKKVDTTIHTLLKMSRLPLKDPKTFENFDFSVIKGRDASRLKTLPSLSAIYAHRNLAFIGPAGTGKTHLAQAFGYECCQRGIQTYFIKMSELRDKFTAARRAGTVIQPVPCGECCYACCFILHLSTGWRYFPERRCFCGYPDDRKYRYDLCHQQY